MAVGTLVSTQEGQVFETTAPRTLRRDQLSVVVPVRAQQEGPAGAVAPGAITLINRPIFGIESVTNERATFFATERETDEELRRAGSAAASIGPAAARSRRSAPASSTRSRS